MTVEAQAVRAEKLGVRDLNVYYRSFQALKNASLSVEEHRVTALIGPSGCGKSTFLDAESHARSYSRRAESLGSSFSTERTSTMRRLTPLKIRHRIGMVFQRPNPFPQASSKISSTVRKSKACAIKARLERNLRAKSSRSSTLGRGQGSPQSVRVGLSGGQQQRLCIARVLAVQPEVILMDEPASALDPIATAKVEDLINELKRDYTVVIVTHSMQQAARISDFTAFFLMGEIIEVGTTTDMFTHPKDKRAEDYITGRFG